MHMIPTSSILTAASLIPGVLGKSMQVHRTVKLHYLVRDNSILSTIISASECKWHHQLTQRCIQHWAFSSSERTLYITLSMLKTLSYKYWRCCRHSHDCSSMQLFLVIDKLLCPCDSIHFKFRIIDPNFKLSERQYLYSFTICCHE